MHSDLQRTRLEDYRPADCEFAHVWLLFDLDPDTTRVCARWQYHGLPPHTELVLDAGDLQVDSLAIDAKPLDPVDWAHSNGHLRIRGLPESGILEIHSSCSPRANTALDGLYLSEGRLVTQCEPQGFRNIVPSPDRPDVLCRYRVELRADARQFPCLLSNGNLLDAGNLDDGRHFCVWEDPFPKPSYLFALVAGDLAEVRDQYRAADGRDIDIRFYTEERFADRMGFAIQSLKRAMRWDEQHYGRVCDLDRYQVVAVSDFNMGAMENKGLNIFNTKCVLGDAQTATDDDLAVIESVIAHEYFHNWSGNRVTCRDWFQLSLKEGFTVFRDQCFSADMGSPAIKRVNDVERLRTHQFAEDASGLAHPVQPREYAQINNFYTLTIYEKGAEIVRMLSLLLGPHAFRAATDEYFERFDGQAVRIEDFLECMQQHCPRNLQSFLRWYQTPGTPLLDVQRCQAADGDWVEVHMRQRAPLSQYYPEQSPLPIPVALAFRDPHTGALLKEHQIETHSNYDRSTGVFMLDQPADHLRVRCDSGNLPVPSVLRGLSAPVRLETDLTTAELGLLARSDDDALVACDAAAELARQQLKRMLSADRNGTDDWEPIDAFMELPSDVLDAGADPALVAAVLRIPPEAALIEDCAPVDPGVLCRARDRMLIARGRHNRHAFRRVLEHFSSIPDEFSAGPVGQRRLYNAALGSLVALEDAQAIALAQTRARQGSIFDTRLHALQILCHWGVDGWQDLLHAFRQSHADDPLMMDRWFSLQAGSPRLGTLEHVEQLARDDAYQSSNPNRVRALLGAFVRNERQFNRPESYAWMAERIRELAGRNPQLAARLLGAAFSRYRNLGSDLSSIIRGQILPDFMADTQLPTDVREIAHRSLNAPETPAT